MAVAPGVAPPGQTARVRSREVAVSASPLGFGHNTAAWCPLSPVQSINIEECAEMSKVEMLTPENCAIALIDYQPAMYQGIQSHDRLVVFNNAQVLAKTARLFKIPTVLSTVAEKSFSGPFMSEVTGLFPTHEVID